MIAKTILLVEDEENDVFFFQRAMKKAAVVNPLQVASDGQAAIDYLKGTGKFADRAKFPLPGLILLDLKLPYVMGLDVLKWIRQQPGFAMTVVILTSSRDQGDIATAYRLGANAYLVKPPELNGLEDMVRAVSNFWLIHNTPSPEARSDRGLQTLETPHTKDFPNRHASPTNPPARLPSSRSPNDL